MYDEYVFEDDQWKYPTSSGAIMFAVVPFTAGPCADLVTFMFGNPSLPIWACQQKQLIQAAPALSPN